MLSARGRDSHSSMVRISADIILRRVSLRALALPVYLLLATGLTCAASLNANLKSLVDGRLIDMADAVNAAYEKGQLAEYFGLAAEVY